MREVGRIENITDQIEGYCDEVAITVETMMEKHNLTWQQAMQVVHTGVLDMMTEMFHHNIYDVANVIDDLTESVSYLGDK